MPEPTPPASSAAPPYAEASPAEMMKILASFKQDLDQVRADNRSLRCDLDLKEAQIRSLAADLVRRDEQIQGLVAENNRKDGEIRNLLEGLRGRAEELKNVPAYRLKKRDASREEGERLSTAKYKTALVGFLNSVEAAAPPPRYGNLARQPDELPKYSPERRQ